MVIKVLPCALEVARSFRIVKSPRVRFRQSYIVRRQKVVLAQCIQFMTKRRRELITLDLREVGITGSLEIRRILKTAKSSAICLSGGYMVSGKCIQMIPQNGLT
jgi:hypothetical protein